MGLTTAELAERSLVPEPEVLSYESGEADPRAETLDKLLRGCGHVLRARKTPLPSSLEEFSERFAGLAEPTADDVTRTVDGREIRTAEDLAGFVAELRGEGLLVQ